MLGCGITFLVRHAMETRPDEKIPFVRQPL